MVEDMANHPKLPEPFQYHIPAVNPNATAGKEKMLPCQHAAERQLVIKGRVGPQATWAGSFSKCQLVNFLLVTSAFVFKDRTKGSLQLPWTKELIRHKSILF